MRLSVLLIADEADDRTTRSSGYLSRARSAQLEGRRSNEAYVRGHVCHACSAWAAGSQCAGAGAGVSHTFLSYSAAPWSHFRLRIGTALDSAQTVQRPWWRPRRRQRSAAALEVADRHICRGRGRAGAARVVKRSRHARPRSRSIKSLNDITCERGVFVRAGAPRRFPGPHSIHEPTPVATRLN